jgi:hypothetical protein
LRNPVASRSATADMAGDILACNGRQLRDFNIFASTELGKNSASPRASSSECRRGRAATIRLNRRMPAVHDRDRKIVDRCASRHIRLNPPDRNYRYSLTPLAAGTGGKYGSAS